jgi:hypothetical protein
VKGEHPWLAKADQNNSRRRCDALNPILADVNQGEAD